MNDNTELATSFGTDGGEHKAAKAGGRGRVAEKIRSELNIEKWPAIWQPAKSKNKPTLRVMEREMTAAGGNRLVSRVEVGYTHLGTLTTEEQKMLYVLIRLWEESGKPDSQVFFSSRLLARMLKKKGWGSNVITAITKSLRKLRTIPIEWINSYYDRAKVGAVVLDRTPFSLLSELRIVERRQDGAVNSSLGYFKFDDHVLGNLQLNYTKPVCIEEFFKLRSEIAQLIYSHIDLMLFEKTRYERRSRELFDDLGLKNPEYTHMYERKRAIDKALRELLGIRLSSGVLRSAEVMKTADGKDYKVCFSKASARPEEGAPVQLPDAAATEVVINHYGKNKDEQTLAAEQLVCEFYKLFHGVDSHEPQSKETAQALSLITQHGQNKARHVLSFARSAAAASNFSPQTFGGILQYTSRALADFARKSQPTEISRPVSRRPRSNNPLWYSRGQMRLLALSPEQYQRRYEAGRLELLQLRPHLASVLAEGSDSKLGQAAVRAFLIEQLEHEPMELLSLASLRKPSRSENLAAKAADSVEMELSSSVL